MKYSIGQSLGDFGFAFYEKLHAPIFLINRIGKITKLNEAGRKLLKIAKINIHELDSFATSQILNLFTRSSREGFKRVKIGKSRVNLIVRNLQDSDFLLIEVKH